MLLGHSGLLITWVDTLSLSVGMLAMLRRVMQVANTVGRLKLLFARSHPRIAYNGKTGRANVDYFMHIDNVLYNLGHASPEYYRDDPFPAELLFQVQMSR